MSAEDQGRARGRKPYVKMCGFTVPEQARSAVAMGADLIGLNFYSASARAISFGLGVKIQEAVHRASAERRSERPARTVAVVVDPDVEHVLAILQHVKPDLLQFHGDEPPHVCRYFRTPFIKAFRMKGTADADAIPSYLGGYGVAFLAEAFSGADYGGTGKVLSHGLASAALTHGRGFLAGGLSPDNVREAVRALRPYGVDVASGIEAGRPGIKSQELMAEFMREVRAGAREAAR